MSTPRAAGQSSEPGSKARSALALLVIVAASIVVYFSLNPLPPRFDIGPHQALGEILGAEVLKLREPGGRVIAIVRETQEEFKAPASEAQFAGFQGVLKKAGVKIDKPHRFKIDPLRVVGVAPSDFLEVLRGSSDSDVVISFLGPPTLSDDQLAKLGNKRPKILAVCSGAMPQFVDLHKLFDQKMLAGAVISRADPAAGTGGGQAGFDRVFKWITQGNIAECPSMRSQP